MPRPKSLVPTAALNVHLDAGLKAKLDQTLYSELEERVPHGAYQKFFNLTLTQALTFARLDLAPFGTDPGVAVVRGPADVVNALRGYLEGKR